jgi:hypothetical protein
MRCCRAVCNVHLVWSTNGRCFIPFLVHARCRLQIPLFAQHAWGLFTLVIGPRIPAPLIDVRVHIDKLRGAPPSFRAQPHQRFAILGARGSCPCACGAPAWASAQNNVFSGVFSSAAQIIGAGFV